MANFLKELLMTGLTGGGNLVLPYLAEKQQQFYQNQMGQVMGNLAKSQGYSEGIAPPGISPMVQNPNMITEGGLSSMLANPQNQGMRTQLAMQMMGQPAGLREAGTNLLGQQWQQQQSAANTTMGLQQQLQNQVFQQEQALRKEIQANPTVKEFTGISNSYNDLMTTLSSNSGPASVAAIFKFMKSMDPTSTVRESEYGTVVDAPGMPQGLVGRLNQLLGQGGVLTPRARAELAEIMTQMYNTRRGGYQNILDQYRQGISSRYQGLSPQAAMFGLPEAPQAQMPESLAKFLKPPEVAQQPVGTRTKASSVKWAR